MKEQIIILVWIMDTMHIQTYENECLGTQHKPMLQFKQGTHTQTVRQTDIVFCVYLCLLSRFVCVLLLLMSNICPWNCPTENLHMMSPFTGQPLKPTISRISFNHHFLINDGVSWRDSPRFGFTHTKIIKRPKVDMKNDENHVRVNIKSH